MNKRYRVRLTESEREHLEAVVSKGKAAAYKIKHAPILLKVDASGPQWSNVRQRFVEQGLETALERKPRLTPGRQPVCDGEAEAKLIALRCGPPPAGHGRWTLRLLADRAVQLEIVPTICHETVRQVLKKRVKTAPAETVRDSA
jgi:hypothetical protein